MTTESYKELFRQALRIRLVEERVIKEYPGDKIQSPVHLSIGQEAVAVGVCAALRPQDPLYCTYRSHAFYLAKGGDLNAMMAELYGKVDGCCRGKGGSMHLAAPGVGFMGTSAIVASNIPHAVGAALALKREGKGRIAAAVFGDGACEQGVYHESLNFAALHALPVLFLCENNGLAVHTGPQDRQAFTIRTHAETYGIPTLAVEDGHEFCRVAETVRKAVQDIRETQAPCFVEVKTYRSREHVGPGEDFSAGYRPREDFDSWMAKDPLEQDSATRSDLTPAILSEIDRAIQFAEASAWPGEEELLAHVS